MSALCPAVRTSISVWSGSAIPNRLKLPRVALIYNTVYVHVSETCLEGEEMGSFFATCVCSSADGRCEVWDHCRDLLPLPDRQRALMAPHGCSCPGCASSSLLLSASSQLIHRSFCHSFALHQNSYCVDICSLLYLPCLLWFSSLLKIVLPLAPLQYYIIFFPSLHLSATASAIPSLPEGRGCWHCDWGAWAVGCQKAGSLMTAAGWKRPGK